MTKPFTRISSIRQATVSIYSPFALARGSRATIKGGDGDFGTDALGPHAERALDRPGRRAAMVPAEPWCESRLSSREKETWSKPFWQAHRGGVQQAAPRLGCKPSGFPRSRRTVLFSGGRRGPGHPRGGQGPAAGRRARGGLPVRRALPHPCWNVAPQDFGRAAPRRPRARFRAQLHRPGRGWRTKGAFAG